MKRRLLAVAAALALVPAASALSTQDANKLVENFINAPDYWPFDVERIHERGSSYEKQFPNAGASALHPDAEIGPIEKALLLVDAYEAHKPDRVRYQIAYSHVVEDADGEQSIVMLVEVRRYNLGPLIHKFTAEDYGPENTAPIEDFGVGPDVAWRFAFATVQGNSALALSGSRAVIAEGAEQLNDTEAGDACLAGPCRSIAARAMEYAPREANAPETFEAKELTAPYTSTYGGEDMVGQNAAFVARNLQAFLGLEEDGAWKTPETPEAGEPGQPFLLMQIDQNLGQEIVTEGAAAYLRLNDTSVRDIYVTAAFWAGQPPMEPTRRIAGR